MIAPDRATALMDRGEVVGSDGGTIGKIGQVYMDSETGQLTWLTVKTGWFGSNESFVPLDNAALDGFTVSVPYDKSIVKGAPHHEVGAELSIQDEDDLYSYYGVRHDTSGIVDTGRIDSGVSDTDILKAGAPVRPIEPEGFITRSEEQLRVGTQRVEAGRARLKKFVVTEQQTVTVPISHDEVHIVRETLAPGDITDATIGDDAVEIILMADEVVVEKDTVAVEKVTLGTEVITEQQAVTGTVRKEQVEVHTYTPDTPDGQPTRPTGNTAADTVNSRAPGGSSTEPRTR